MITTKPLKINNLTRHHTSINMKEYRFTVTDLLMERPNLIAKKKIPVSLCEPESWFVIKLGGRKLDFIETNCRWFVIFKLERGSKSPRTCLKSYFNCFCRLYNKTPIFKRSLVWALTFTQMGFRRNWVHELDHLLPPIVYNRY